MGDIRLTSPLVRIVRDGVPDPLDVQTDNRDMLLWEQTRARHKWDGFQTSPLTWMTFLAWSAARRQGAIDAGLTWEKWKEEVLDVADITVRDGDDDAGTPFPEEADPDSS